MLPVKRGPRGRVEGSRVQILVVVARIQVRLLKAEEGEVSEVTVFGFG